MKIQHHNKILDLTTPQVMGILNVTPDSFSDGGCFNHLDSAMVQAEQMLNDGATIIDIGGESTRPGAPLVTVEQELERVIPVIEKIRQHHDCWISIDTSKAVVMREAVRSGANLINDVRALKEPGALDAAIAANVPVCLMHMQGQPQTMQAAPHYEDVIEDVLDFFEQRINDCVEAGLDYNKIIVDPGFGFGKTMAHNFALIKYFKRFSHFGLPLLAGLSRKSMFEQLLGAKVDQRLAPSLAGALLCAQQGANIVRVHDVKATADVLAVFNATR